MVKPILRIGVMNNFNFTDAELKQLEDFKEWDVFVNANAKTKIRGDVPAFVTINPDLDVFVEPRGNISCIKAVRVKYVSDPTDVVDKAFKESIAWAKEHSIPALITFMRFGTSDDLAKYTTSSANYAWEKSYFRQKKLRTWKDKNIRYCDLAVKGCPSCNNCARLSFGQPKAKVFGVNLSTSGSCPHNCPSCFSKRLTRCFGITYDKPSQNSKQKGHK